MKCILIYFSQTGNTEKIARAIHTGIKQAAGHCDLVPIKEANPKRLYSYDLIGLGSPVMYIEPANVTAFIRDMRFLGGKHIFSFCTHCTMGYPYNPSVVPQLRKKGLVVVGWNDWYGSSWGPPNQPTPYLTDGHPDEIDLKQAEAWGKDMVWRSQRISAGETELIPEGPEPFIRPDFGDDSLVKALHFRKVAKFESEKCLYPECRLCMDHCPVDGIDLTVKPVILGKPCIDCIFCEQICPTGAIHIDDEVFEKLLGWHGNVIKNICAPYLDAAEKQGRFRRLMPEEKVGWNTGIYKVHNKHPRFIIGKGPA